MTLIILNFSDETAEIQKFSGRHLVYQLEAKSFEESFLQNKQNNEQGAPPPAVTMNNNK
jgi:hypothetical protein